MGWFSLFRNWIIRCQVLVLNTVCYYPFSCYKDMVLFITIVIPIFHTCHNVCHYLWHMWHLFVMYIPFSYNWKDEYIIWAYEVASNQNMKDHTSDLFFHFTFYENHKNIFHIRYFLIMTNLFIIDQIDKIVLLSRLVISISRL